MNDYFATEEELQAHCAEVLRHRGLRPRREVPCGENYRADIVAGGCIYEVKLVLNYDNLYKALGQAQMYARLLHKSHIHLVGYAPRFTLERQKAERLAAQFRSIGIKVSFVDEDPFWELVSVEAIGWRIYRYAVLCFLGLGIILYTGRVSGALLDSRECKVYLRSYTCVNTDGITSEYKVW